MNIKPNGRIADDRRARSQYVLASRAPLDMEDITRLLFKKTTRATFGGSWTSTMRMYENGVQVAVDKVADEWSSAKCLGIYVGKKLGNDIPISEDQWEKCIALLRTKYETVETVGDRTIIYLIKPHARA